ncbi:MAG: TIM barrel protein [Pirellulales bacterium]|nr:TIM barrel protein [Pirellulales bacterium]
MTISRRNIIKFGIGATTMLATGTNPFAAMAADCKGKIPIGLQLYSVREACQKDLPGVLKKVAAMGYDGVEFAGYYGFSADELKKMLDENGLKCCGTHIRREDLIGDNLQKTIDFNKKIGNRYLIVAWMPHSYMKSIDTIKEAAKFFNDVAAKAKKQGMLVGYHAHGGDFKKVGGQTETAWNMLFNNLDPEVVMQMDMGNCRGGGGDPIAVLKKYPGRAKTVHLKEDGGKKDALIGEGEIDWKAVFDICKSTGGTEWMIVEYEHKPRELDPVGKCLKNVRKMLK